ncbi:MAG: GntR family transcriptional regulator [Acidimicrobiales bacterium]|nr:GntR family transcriptional regulator [Acidimicrobiales bacterium]
MSGQERQIRYRAIADDLRRQIEVGVLAAGAVLPSEAALARAHEVSRVTVRKALEVLRDEGRIDSRQGFGWFVAGDRVRQSLGALSTIEAQLTEQGREPVRRVVSFGFDHGGSGDLVVVRVNLADGRPFAIVTVWCPAELGSGLSRDDVESSTFYELLSVTFAGATQSIGAAVADERDAELLEVPVGSPLLVVERVSHDVDGRDVLRSEHRFPAHLTEFVVELPFRAGEELSPPGLRLVE